MKRKFPDYLKLGSKGIISLLIFMVFSQAGFSQSSGISPTGVAPDPSAGLDVNFATKGLLIPRVALTATTNTAPLTAHVAGMVIYNTATAGDVIPGFYYNDGAKWIMALPKGASPGDMQYWNGTTWVIIPAGAQGQKLQLNASNVPVWVQ